MKNKIVGYLVIFIAVLMFAIILLFNRGLTDIVNTSCDHGASCPMWKTIDYHTNISIGITIFVLLIGIFLVFFGNEEKIITILKTRNIVPKIKSTQITKEKYSNILSELNPEEKVIFEKIIESQGSIYQSEIVKKTDWTKVKVTRILDKLEGKNLIERKRRGMTNIILLKKQ